MEIDGIKKKVADCEAVVEYMLTTNDKPAPEDMPVAKGAVKREEEDNGNRLKFNKDVEGFPPRRKNINPACNGLSNHGGCVDEKKGEKGQRERERAANYGRECNKYTTLMFLLYELKGQDQIKLTGSLMILSSLKDAKSGVIESAIMVKDFIYRNRDEVSAWAVRHFPSH